MKVITIKQPYASLIVNGYKEYEFRSWKTKYRGEIYIHAGKSIDKKALKYFEILNLDFPIGQIIGVANLIECVEITKDFEEKLIKENELVYGYTKDRNGYAFKLENIKKLNTPITINGKLGIWNYEKNS